MENIPAQPSYGSQPSANAANAAYGGPTGVGAQPVPSTQVRPASDLRGGPSQTVRTGTPPPQPPAYSTQYAQPGYAPPPGGAAPPRARRGAGGWFGCAAIAALFLVLAVGIGAAIALSGQGGFAFPGFPGGVAQATETPEPGEPTDLPIPTLTNTIEPTITATFESTPTLTFTPEPTLTPTLEPTATETLVPTETPLPPFELVIEHAGNEGMVLINDGVVPFPVALIEFWDNDPELNGGEWEVDFLQPGQCVLVWESGGRPELPEGVQCEQVGEVPERRGRTRFWTRTMNIRFQGVEITSCRADEQRCEITIP